MRLVVMVCLAVAVAFGARAGERGAAPTGAKTEAKAEASLSGTDGDAERWLRGAVGAVSHQLLARWLAVNPQRDLVLHLDSPGGKAVFGARSYEAIEGQGRVATTVDAGQVCLSACAYLWLAGRSRGVGDAGAGGGGGTERGGVESVAAPNGGTLGFHSAYCTAACDLRGVGAINQSLLDILARTEPALALMLSRTGAMISGNTVLALARRVEGKWVMRLVRPVG